MRRYCLFFAPRRRCPAPAVVFATRFAVATVALIALLGWRYPAAGGEITLLNVSYDPTRELYQEFNAAFAKHWREQTGDTVVVRQSHGVSGKQARSVIDGLEADVVSLALAYDIDALGRQAGLVPADWQSRFPDHSSPYVSTIVFLVRKGNPKGIKDWSDLVKPGVSVISPNPKTSGGARWNYLAAWGYALKTDGADERKAQEFVARLYRNVPVLDSGARGATTTFAQRGIGDVLVSWENEAFLALREFATEKFELVAPPMSILAEPPVAVVEKVARRHGVETVAKAYLDYLYSETGQRIIGRNFYRPRDPTVAAAFADKFPAIKLFTIEEICGDWQRAQTTHFSEGGVFDQIYQPGK